VIIPISMPGLGIAFMHVFSDLAFRRLGFSVSVLSRDSPSLLQTGANIKVARHLPSVCTSMAGAHEPVAIRKRRRPAAPKDKGWLLTIIMRKCSNSRRTNVRGISRATTRCKSSRIAKRLRRALYLRLNSKRYVCVNFRLHL
jgi:hypothetical protein